jgi:hypothetical protein
MQDEEDETEHLPLRLGVTVVLPSLTETEISRSVAGFMAASGRPATNARACGAVPAGVCGEARLRILESDGSRARAALAPDGAEGAAKSAYV